MTYVVDISHYQTPTSFAAAYAWGLRGVIMKASQGVRTADPHFTKAMCDDVTGAGLLLGAYDFNTGDPPREQVDFFLGVVQPDKELPPDSELIHAEDDEIGFVGTIQHGD